MDRQLAHHPPWIWTACGIYCAQRRVAATRTQDEGRKGMRTSTTTRRTRVAVVEEHEILRYGLVACLAEDQRLEVVVAGAADVAGRDVDIAVVSSTLARDLRFPCPII